MVVFSLQATVNFVLYCRSYNAYESDVQEWFWAFEGPWYLKVISGTLAIVQLYWIIFFCGMCCIIVLFLVITGLLKYGVIQPPSDDITDENTVEQR